MADRPVQRNQVARVRRRYLSGLCQRGRFAQYVTACPDGLNEFIATRRTCQLLAQLADKYINDLWFRLIHTAVEMIEKHFLGQRRAFAQRNSSSI